MILLAFVILSSFNGAFFQNTTELPAKIILPGASSDSVLNSTNLPLSYKVSGTNSSLLGSALSSNWTATGNSLIKKVESLKIPEKAKLLPNFKIAPARSGNAYVPSYKAGPAPMGIGSYGVLNKSGSLTPYNYSTTSFEGSVNITNASELNLGIASPTSYGIQLNAVLNNVTLFGVKGYQYWTQNVVAYTGSNHTLTFIDNIWNFTSPNAVINGSEFYSHNGTVVPGAFYYTVGPTISVSFPFTLNLYLNSTDSGNRNTVFFNYSLNSGGQQMSGSYDEVQFNSTHQGTAAIVKPANFEVSGNTLTGTGFIPMDAEMIIGGPGGGSSAVLQNINATMNLDYLDSSGLYSPVASAYSAGSETGETSSGISESYTGTTAHLTSGPTFVTPLWGISGTQVYRTLSGSVAPSNSFVFINNGTTVDNGTAQWAPLATNGSFDYVLPSGNYSIEILLSYHNPLYEHADLSNGNLSLGKLILSSNTTAGLYSPLYAYNNAQLSSLSTGGTGTSANPYLVPGPYYYSSMGITVKSQLASVFSQINDYLFPTFNGILVSGTTDYAVFDGFQTSGGNPVFPVLYPRSTLSALTNYFQVTDGNYLNMVFYNSSHIILNNSVISGWFSAAVYSGLNMYNIPVVGSLLLWNTTSTLIEHNNILSDGSGILVYGPQNEVLNNIIWNNTFGNGNAVPAGAFFGTDPIGLTLAGSGNTVYNNVFNSVIPIASIDGKGSDIYTGGNAVYTNSFNITSEPASQSTTFNGVSLSGSILGLQYQSGNYYYNYFGNGSQPYNGTGVGFAFDGQGALNGSINYGYDYSPLVKYGYTANVSATGLPGGYQTYFDINNGIYQVAPGTSTQLYLPNGSYDILGFILYNSQMEYLPESVLGNVNLSNGYFAVSGPLMDIFIAYSVYYNLTVSESGLPNGTLWGFSVPQAGIGYTLTNSSQSLFVATGTYDIFPQSVAGFYSTPEIAQIIGPTLFTVYYSNLSTSGNATTYSVSFTENGLPAGTAWGVHIGGKNYVTGNTTITFIDVQPGTYQFSVLNISGYSVVSSGTFTVGPQNASVYITFMKSQGSGWPIYLGIGALVGVVAGAGAMFLRIRKR